MSGGGDPERSRTAMDAATGAPGRRRSCRSSSCSRRPSHDTPKEPGYIKSYPPGVRENGGQYTHAATWFVIALAEMGRADEAWRCFSMLNPVNHALDEDAAEHYRVEPYVVAADVYSVGDKGGRGGWTWYTGSAGWLYRAAVESILGISREGDRLIDQAGAARPLGRLPGDAATFRRGLPHPWCGGQEGAEPAVEVDGHRSRGIDNTSCDRPDELEISVIMPGQ